jgi:hypothetical protein
MVEKFKQSVKESHSEQYEGVAEKGLRMLVFGKPGSGKVSHYSLLAPDRHSYHTISPERWPPR